MASKAQEPTEQQSLAESFTNYLEGMEIWLSEDESVLSHMSGSEDGMWKTVSPIKKWRQTTDIRQSVTGALTLGIIDTKDELAPVNFLMDTLILGAVNFVFRLPVVVAAHLHLVFEVLVSKLHDLAVQGYDKLNDMEVPIWQKALILPAVFVWAPAFLCTLFTWSFLGAVKDAVLFADLLLSEIVLPIVAVVVGIAAAVSEAAIALFTCLMPRRELYASVSQVKDIAEAGYKQGKIWFKNCEHRFAAFFNSPGQKSGDTEEGIELLATEKVESEKAVSANHDSLEVVNAMRSNAF